MNFKAIAFGVLVGVVITTIYFQQREIRVLQQQVAQQQLGANIASRVTTQEEFAKNLSPKDALLWTQFLPEATDMPDETFLPEYKESTDFRTIPIGVRFRKGNDQFFTVVVGTRTIYGDPQFGQSVFTPTLAYYTSNRYTTTRLSRLSATPEIEVGLQWRTVDGVMDYDLYREYLEKDLRDHLNGKQR